MTTLDREPDRGSAHPIPRMIGALDLRLAHVSLHALEDADLVVMARSGRSEAFDELVRRHAPRLHAVASRVVGREEAHDVVQEAFVAALRALGSFRNEARFTTWIHRIVLNCCYGQLRRGGRGGLELPADAEDGRPGPADAAERRDLRAALERALSRIRPEFRETFVLVEFGDLDHAQVAEVLGVPVGTVKSRMSRAREALRAHLSAEGYGP